MLQKIVFILFLIVMISCTGIEPNDQKNDEYNPQYGSLKDTVLYALEDSLIVTDYKTTVTEPRISIGENGGATVHSILKFNVTNQSKLTTDTAVVLDSAYIKLRTSSQYGKDKTENTDMVVYEIMEFWDSTKVNTDSKWRNPKETNFISELKTVKVNTKDSAYTKIPLSISKLKEWANKPLKDNYGLLLSSNDMVKNNIVSFYSTNFGDNKFEPYLFYYSHKDTIKYVDSVAVLYDASIFNYDSLSGTALLDEPNTIILSSGVTRSTLLKFDLEGLRKDIIIYDVNLSLSEKEINEYESEENKKYFLLKSVEKWDSDISKVKYNPASNAAFNMNSNNDSTFIVTPNRRTFSSLILQQVINGNFKSPWLHVEFQLNNMDFSVKKYYGVQSDKMLRPKLKIRYIDTEK